MIVRLLSFSTSIAAFFLIAGCGPKDDGPRVVPKGKLMDGAKPYVYEAPKVKGGGPTPPPSVGNVGSGLQIQFTPVEGGDVYYASFNAESSTFEVKGSDGKGLKPGKYKVFLTMAGAAPGGEIFGGKFTRDKSQIERDVQVDGPEIIIDVSKPKG